MNDGDVLSKAGKVLLEVGSSHSLMYQEFKDALYAFTDTLNIFDSILRKILDNPDDFGNDSSAQNEVSNYFYGKRKVMN